MGIEYSCIAKMQGIDDNKYIVEKRVISGADLRGLCAKYEWYTLGDKEDFFAMWYDAEEIENVTTYDLFELAKDIWLHSDLDVWKEEFLIDEIKRIMFLIERKCCHTYFSIKNK